MVIMNEDDHQEHLSFLYKGSKVEVWSDEDGFKNAWFSAEVLSSPSYSRPSRGKKLKKTPATAMAVVKYDHMLSDDGREPLVEKIETSFLRPEPPPDFSSDCPLEIYDVVDAFYQDAWWTGFVVKVANDRYNVAFKNPPDLLEFGRDELRRHWDWVGSKWIRPQKEDTTGLIYIPGTEVEVNRHDEVPCHAWLPAVVIGQAGLSTSFLVKYKNADSDGEEGLEQEFVDLDQIRPRPPVMEDKNFDVLERVDVFHGSCWWVGLITRLLGGERYIVTLRHKKEMEFSHFQLRPHLEWIDGHWVTKSKGVKFTSDCQQQNGHTLHENSCSMLDDIEQGRHCSSDKEDGQKMLSPCVKKSPYSGSLIMEKENPISCGDRTVEIILFEDGEKTKQQEAGETESQAVKSAKKRGRPRKSCENSGSSVNPQKERPCLSDKQDNRKELIPSVEKSPNFGSLNMEKENHISCGDKPVQVIPNGDDKKTMQQEAGETEGQAVKSAKKRGRPRKSHEGSVSLTDNAGKERPCSSDKQDNRKESTPYVEKSISQPYFGSSSMEKENHISSGDKPDEATPNGDDTKTKRQDAGEMENQIDKSSEEGRSQQSEPSIPWHKKRRRDCPSRSNLAATEIADMEIIEAVVKELEVCDMLGDSEGVKGLHVAISCQPPVEDDAGRSSEITGNGEHLELPVTNAQAAEADEELSGTGGGVVDCTTGKSELPVTTEVILTDKELSGTGGGVVDCTTGKSELPVTTEVILTDTPEEEGTTLVCPTSAKISSDDGGVKEAHSTTNVCESDVQNLPFVKSYPIWQVIESMEVFKKLPQNPNFEPLMKCNEVKREGAAIGHMMYFVSLVEKISKLGENDTREDLESMMEGLAELEEMGFDVKVVRGRVSELLRTKVELEKLICKSKGLESQIEECRDEKFRIAGTVADTERELKRLEEKRAKLMSEKMNNGSKELELISEADGIYKGISSAWEIFRSLVVAPW